MSKTNFIYHLRIFKNLQSLTYDMYFESYNFMENKTNQSIERAKQCLNNNIIKPLISLAKYCKKLKNITIRLLGYQQIMPKNDFILNECFKKHERLNEIYKIENDESFYKFIRFDDYMIEQNVIKRQMKEKLQKANELNNKLENEQNKKSKNNKNVFSRLFRG